MKKILRYVILLIIAIIAVRVIVYFLTKPYYKDMNNYQIITNNPLKIEITESKVARNKGYIKGTATNDTKELIPKIYIKFDFYDNNERFIGSEYKLIETFNATEQANFDIKYQYQGVAEIRISIVKQ